MFNLANKITMVRIFAVIPIIVLLSSPGRWSCFLCAILFIAASLTDYLDGHIARKAKLVSSFGKFLDPLADKILNCSLLVMLSSLGWIPAWVTILIIIRELGITGLRAMAMEEGVVIAADKYGKLKTVFQIIALVPLIFHYPVFGLDVGLVGMLILYVALVLTILSGIHYTWQFYALWRVKNSVADS